MDARIETGGAASFGFKDAGFDFSSVSPHSPESECPAHLLVVPGVFRSSSLSLTRHFLKSASPRKKTDCSCRFQFRAREQTAASRLIFATLFAFPVAAPLPLAARLALWCPAPWWLAPW